MCIRDRTITEKKSFGKFTSRLQKLSFPNVGHSLTPDFNSTSNVSKPSANQDSSDPISSSTPPIGGGKSFGKSFVTLKNIGNKWKRYKNLYECIIDIDRRLKE